MPIRIGKARQSHDAGRPKCNETNRYREALPAVQHFARPLGARTASPKFSDNAIRSLLSARTGPGVYWPTRRGLISGEVASIET